MAPLYELISGISIILALGLGGLFVNILLHELGHAIPILFWSKKKVMVFIGSLGDSGRSFRLPFGRLEVFIKHNPFLWFRGLCRPGERLTVNKMIVYTAMGPFASLLTTAICFLLLKTIEPNGRQTVVLVTLMVIGGMYTFTSIIPNGRLFVAHSGRGMQNDAAQIVQMWKTRGLPDAYWVALDKIRAREFHEASVLVEKMIDEGVFSIVVLRLAVAVHIKSGNYERAESILEMIRSKHRFSLEDQINDGCHKILVGRYRHAVDIYTELLRLHNNNFLILNNIGYSLIAVGDSKKALFYLDRGIALAPRFAELYANRAWAKMELERWDEGAADARFALGIDETSADAYRALGLYALAKQELQEAKSNFLKAKSLDPFVQFVDEHLATIEDRLKIYGGGGAVAKTEI